MDGELTRRELFRRVTGVAAVGAIGLRATAQQEGSAMPDLHVYEDYGWLRGFSVVPSWGARIEEAWWAYDGARFREEIEPATRMHTNCMRLWIDFTAWMADPDVVTERFVDAVTACGELGMTAMPCLFNRWHDFDYDYGGQYTEDLYRNFAPKLAYVRAVVEPLKDDPRVLVWDLCNEPQAFSLAADWEQREVAFLTQVSETIRELGARQPITIGTMVGTNIETYAPICDVLCAHPYVHTEPELALAIAALDGIRKRHNKPMLVNETIPGCLDDMRRAALARFYTRLLAEAGLGWMGWALREGKAISTRRDRHDANGLDGQGFHPYVNRDGSLRAGLEFLCDRPMEAPPWAG